MEWMNTAWFWWALALALFAIEALAPGAFMLWLGLAALATGLVQLLFPESGLVVQWILFGVFALLAAGLGRRWRMRNPPRPSDQPLLNRRVQHLLDQVHPLESPIRNGRGRIKVGDAFWQVEGEDADAGTRVRIIAVDGMTLRVRAVE